MPPILCLAALKLKAKHPEQSQNPTVSQLESSAEVQIHQSLHERKRRIKKRRRNQREHRLVMSKEVLQYNLSLSLNVITENYVVIIMLTSKRSLSISACQFDQKSVSRFFTGRLLCLILL